MSKLTIVVTQPTDNKDHQSIIVYTDKITETKITCVLSTEMIRFCPLSYPNYDLIIQAQARCYFWVLCYQLKLPIEIAWMILGFTFDIHPHVKVFGLKNDIEELTTFTQVDNAYSTSLASESIKRELRTHYFCQQCLLFK